MWGRSRSWFLILCVPVLLAQPHESELLEHFRKATEAQQRGQLRVALDEFEKASTLDPNRGEIHARLGMIYQDLGMLAESAASLERALQLEPGLPGVGLLLAFAYQGMGRNREAIPYLSKAFEVETQMQVRLVAGQRLVDACFVTGETARGLEVVQKLRQMAPNNPDVLYTSSKVYANLWNSAVQQLIESAPGSYRVHQVFAEVFEAQDRFADAAKEYRQIIRMEPNLPGAHYRLGRMILRTGDNPENDATALVEFRRELEISPSDVPAHVEIGEIYLRAHKPDDAFQSFSRAVALQPEYAPGRLGLAKVYIFRGQFPEAVKELERAAHTAPEDDAIQYNLMLAYRNLGRNADAQRAQARFRELKQRDQQKQASLLNQLKGVPVQAPRPQR